LVEHFQICRVAAESVYGPAATKENDFAFNYLPKIDRNYSWVNIWNDMYEGKVKGLFAFGMNGVMIGPDSNKNIDALKKADWLVVCEIYPDETSEFWRAPGITAEDQKKINTTVYRLPGAGFAEKDGTFVNSARWLQWKNIALPPPGQARLDQEILATIFLKVRELYKKEGGKFPDPVLNATFAYTNPHNPLLAEVAREINGKALADITDPKTNITIKAGQQLPGFAWLKDDGTTTSGNWLYCGSWTEAGAMMQRRGTDDPSGLGIYPNWGWSWPANRRVLYNRASCDMEGKPWILRGDRFGGRRQAELGGRRRSRFQSRFRAQRSHGPLHHESRWHRTFIRATQWNAGRTVPRVLRADREPACESVASEQSNNPVVKKYKTDMDKYAKPVTRSSTSSVPPTVLPSTITTGPRIIR